MIFKPELAAEVMAGRKWETRRPVRFTGPEGRTVVPTQYKVGRDYAVQPGRGKFAIGRIRVTLVEQTVLGAMTPDQAMAEGFVDYTRGDPHGDIAAFRAYWERLYGEGTARVSVPVWRIAFERMLGDPLEGARR